MTDEPNEQEIYAGKILTLRLKYLPQPDGSRRLREIIEHAPGAAVVAVDPDGKILLVRQHRPAVERDMLELPAGLVDPGEEPIDCAGRELLEETGYRAAHLAHLVSFYSSPGFSTELLHVFFATDLELATTHYDEEEEIEVLHMDLDAAIELVLTREISDAKTVSGLLAYKMSSGRSTISR